MTSAYWSGQDSGEKSVCLMFGVFFFVLAMAVLVIDESILEFNLDTGKMFALICLIVLPNTSDIQIYNSIILHIAASFIADLYFWKLKVMSCFLKKLFHF